MYSVIQVDNPWKFRNEKTGGNHQSGASQKYPVMELGQILALPVGAVVNHTAVLFLWVPTALKFSHGGQCLTAWGFTYKTTVYWDKMQLGMGAWFRNEVEELLVGVRGDPAPFGCQLPNIIHQVPGEHSEKPDEFTRLIETATGAASSRRNLEVFARKDRPGWRCIGNQVTGHDVREDLRLIVMQQRCTIWQHNGANIPRCLTCGGLLGDHTEQVLLHVANGRNALLLRDLGRFNAEQKGG